MGFPQSSGRGLPVDPVTGAAAGTVMLGTQVTGDTVDRIQITAGGTINWGPGNGAVDVTMARNAGAVLRVNPGTLSVGGSTLCDSEISARNTAATQAKIGAVGPASQAAIAFGSAATDSLYRSGAGVIRANSTFGADGTLYADGTAIGFKGGTYAGATLQGGIIAFGTGAPNNANGANGDIYFRVDGGALTTIYQRRAGVWTGIV